MYNECFLYVKACILGDGSLTKIEAKNTVMLSFTHGSQQKAWLQAKADKLTMLMGRPDRQVGERKQYDARTDKEYGTCQFTLTSKEFIPLYDIAYPSGVKTFSEELLKGLGAEHLAVFWADDGNLEPKARVGRLNVYKPESECLIVRDWIESVCGAVGRYEDYEGNGIGRLRYPASEMAKVAVVITPYLHPMMLYKVDMRYKNNTKAKALLTASSPNSMSVDELPELDSMTHRQWGELAKSLGVSGVRNGTKSSLRQRIIDLLVDDKRTRVQGNQG